MFDKVKSFFNRHYVKLTSAPAIAGVITAASGVASHAADYSPQAVPTAGTMDLTQVGNVWQYAQSFLQDTIAIISTQPLLVVMVIALPLVGMGVGLFKRIVSN